MAVFHEGVNEIKLIDVECVTNIWWLFTSSFIGMKHQTTLHEWNMIGFNDKRTQVKRKELMPGVIIVSLEDLIRKNPRLNDR